jgi:hypothetical protein
MIIHEHDRDGSIWRTIKCLDFFPSTPPTGLNDDNYDSMGDAKTVSITFLVDSWIEEINGMPKYVDGSGFPIEGEYFGYNPTGVYSKSDY